MSAAWLGALVAAAVSLGVISLLWHSRLADRLADHPNERSLHQSPVPRVGGLGLLAGALPVVIAQGPAELRLVGFVAALLALLSLADDLRALPATIRLAFHLTGAALVVVAIGGAPAEMGAVLRWLMPLPVAVGIAWMTNLFNFMDGADGLAGGMAAIGFAVLAWAAADAGIPALSVATAALSGASLGFLAFNFPPARVFLGDAGSIPLGFLAGSLGWLGSVWGAWPLWFPVLVFSPFIVDASVTLVARGLRREPLFKAHRSHAYQQLVLGGWSHRRLALTAWPLMAAVGLSAWAALQMRGAGAVAILAGWLALYALLNFAARRRGRGNPTR